MWLVFQISCLFLYWKGLKAYLKKSGSPSALLPLCCPGARAQLDCLDVLVLLPPHHTGILHSWGTCWGGAMGSDPVCAAAGRRAAAHWRADAATASHPQLVGFGIWPEPTLSPFYWKHLFFMLKRNANGERSYGLHLILKINSVTISGKFRVTLACNTATSVVLQKHKCLLVYRRRHLKHVIT